MPLGYQQQRTGLRTTEVGGHCGWSGRSGFGRRRRHGRCGGGSGWLLWVAWRGDQRWSDWTSEQFDEACGQMGEGMKEEPGSDEPETVVEE